MSWFNASNLPTDCWDEKIEDIENSYLSTLEGCSTEIPVTMSDCDLRLSPEICPLGSTEVEEFTLTSKKTTQWTREEDELLASLAKKHKRNWEKVGSHFPNKSPKAIQKRWANKHDPSLKKTRWSPEEDKLIRSLYKTYGGNWKKIAEMIKGRAPDAIKNRYYGTIKKRYLHELPEPKKQLPSKNLQSKVKTVKPECNLSDLLMGEDEVVESFFVDSNKNPVESLGLHSFELSQEDLNSLSSEEKREKLQYLYANMKKLERYILKVKNQIEEISTNN